MAELPKAAQGTFDEREQGLPGLCRSWLDLCTDGQMTVRRATLAA